MLRKLRSLWARHSILEAKVQQEQCRSKPDQLRLTLLKKMQKAALREISAIEDRNTQRAAECRAVEKPPETRPEESYMFILSPNFDTPFLQKRKAGPLLELEQRMTEFLERKSGSLGDSATELVRRHLDATRRQRMREF